MYGVGFWWSTTQHGGARDQKKFTWVTGVNQLTFIGGHHHFFASLPLPLTSVRLLKIPSLISCHCNTLPAKPSSLRFLVQNDVISHFVRLFLFFKKCGSGWEIGNVFFFFLPSRLFKMTSYPSGKRLTCCSQSVNLSFLTGKTHPVSVCEDIYCLKEGRIIAFLCVTVQMPKFHPENQTRGQIHSHKGRLSLKHVWLVLFFLLFPQEASGSLMSQEDVASSVTIVFNKRKKYCSQT